MTDTIHTASAAAAATDPETERIDAAVKAVSLTLGQEELTALSRPYVPHPVLGHS